MVIKNMMPSEKKELKEKFAYFTLDPVTNYVYILELDLFLSIVLLVILVQHGVSYPKCPYIFI